jgi:hypothetical protein
MRSGPADLDSFRGLGEIRFDVEMLSTPESVVQANSQQPSTFVGPGPPSPQDVFLLFWDLDVTGWQFGQIRTFIVTVSQQPSLIIGNRTKEQILANVKSANLLFTDFVANTSSAYVDNFIVTTVPEPSSGAMFLSVGMLVAMGYCRRRSVHIREELAALVEHALFDYLVRPPQYRLRDGDAEGLRGLEVDDEVELRGLLDREVCRLRALENLVDQGRRSARGVSEARRVVHESTRLRPTGLGADERHATL